MGTADTKKKKGREEGKEETRLCTVHIEGMTCGSCVRNIEKAVGGRRGIISASVGLSDRRGQFEYDPALVSPDGVRQYVEDAGFEASLDLPAATGKEVVDKCLISVGGMTCQSCVKSIERQVGEARGVRSIRVSLEEETAFVDFDPAKTDPAKVASAVEDCGFDAAVAAGAEVQVEGMTCQSCVKTIESGIKGEDGVRWVRVSLDEKLARVRFDPAATDAEEVAKKIYDMGFETEVRKVVGGGRKEEKKRPEDVGARKKEVAVGRQEGRKNEEEEEDEDEKCFVSIRGMTCASCVAAIEKHVKKIDGEGGNTHSTP